ncbi:MAG: MATE family efflux transporter, partial [Bacteroidetes bacterium]
LPLAGTPCYIWDGVFIGLTAARAMRDTMLLSLGLFLLAWFFLTPALANHGLWLALILFLLARGAIQWLWYHRRWGDL